MQRPTDPRCLFWQVSSAARSCLGRPDGIARAMSSYVETLKASMAAEHEEREKEMLERISKVEGNK